MVSTYNELKQQIDDLELEQSQLNLDLSSLEGEAEELNKMKTSTVNQYKSDLEKARAAAYKEYATSITKPIEAQIVELKEKKNSVTSKYEQKKASIVFDVVKEEIYHGDSAIDEINEVQQELDSQISEILGEDFLQRTKEAFNNDDTVIQESELASYVDQFNASTARLKKWSKIFKFSLVDKLNDRLDSLNTTSWSSNRFSLPLMLLIIGLIFFVIIKFGAMWYFILLCIVFAEKIVQSTIIAQAQRSSVQVKNNVDLIKQKQAAVVQAEVDRKQAKLLDNYNKACNSLDTSIKEASDHLVDTLNNAKNNFTFQEPQDTKLSMQRVIASCDVKLKQNQENQVSKRQELEKIAAEIKEKSSRISDSICSLVNELVLPSKISQEKIYNPKFLIDVQEDKPKFYSHNYSSTLFLYDSLSEATDFAHLIMQQVRAKLSPFCYSLIVHDSEFACKDFQIFKDSKVALPITLCPDLDTINGSLDKLQQRRLKNVSLLREYESIIEYNKSMLEIDGVPESYYFVFSMCPSPEFLKNQVLQNLALSGGTVGIYLFTFVDLESFSKEKAGMEDVVRCYDQFYFLVNGNFQKRAASFIRNRVLSLGS